MTAIETKGAGVAEGAGVAGWQLRVGYPWAIAELGCKVSIVNISEWQR